MSELVTLLEIFGGMGVSLLGIAGCILRCYKKYDYDIEDGFWDKNIASQTLWNNWEYPKGYRRQLEMYQWLFRRNGFNVSNKGYLLYYNGLKNQPMFNQELKFEKYLIALDCDDSWVEEKIIAAVNTLNADEIPKGSRGCDTCQYLKKRWKVSQSLSTD